MKNPKKRGRDKAKQRHNLRAQTNNAMSTYALSASFTAKDEKTPILRFGAGTTRFRIISDNFLECLSLFCKTADGKGYSKIWEASDDQPDLPAGHEYEQGRKPKRVVLFKAVTDEDPSKGQVLCANLSCTEQILEEANEQQGLTVCWMTAKRTGSGMQTAYRVKSEKATAYNSDWMEVADSLDYSEVIA